MVEKLLGKRGEKRDITRSKNQGPQNVGGVRSATPSEKAKGVFIPVRRGGKAA